MRARFVLLVLGMALLAGVLAYLWSAARSPDDLEQHRLAFDPACDLRQAPCRLALGDGRRLRFAIEPRPIPLLQTLRLEAEVEGPQPGSITVDIVGLNMNMGLNRTVLSASRAGVWTGETVLPVCSRSRMQWEARLRIRDPGARSELIAPFRFQTVR